MEGKSHIQTNRKKLLMPGIMMYAYITSGFGLIFEVFDFCGTECTIQPLLLLLLLTA
jgi:hypothetical protein